MPSRTTSAAAFSRREILGGLALAAAAPSLALADEPAGAAPPDAGKRIRQSVCKWCYGSMPVEDLARNAARMGFRSVELVEPKDWGILKSHGLVCAMTFSHGIAKGINKKENHAECLAQIRDAIEKTSEAGFPNVICFSGNRAGTSDEDGIANCVAAVKEVMALAEAKKVTLCMELLNSKVDHRDYHADRTPWGVEVVKRVGSERFKLLYDIYHMQIMEGDVIRTIRENHAYIGHYHTAGNPGRNEIDESQELNYAAIMRAIADTGYAGFVGQEFVPKKDPMTSLEHAFRVCDV
jgi:hydroxypyruvate isomerase